MDLEVLFTIIALALYFLLQALGNKKKRQTQRRPAPDATQQSGRDTADLPDLSLEDALREIREALGTATQPTARQPEPHREVDEPLPVPTDPDWTVRSQPRFEDRRLPEMSPGPEFQPVAAEHREAHFLADLKEAAPYEPSDIPDVNVDDLDLSRPTRTAQRADLLRRLREPETAREAVLFSEILQPPRALRSQRRS